MSEGGFFDAVRDAGAPGLTEDRVRAIVREETVRAPAPKSPAPRALVDDDAVARIASTLEVG